MPSATSTRHSMQGGGCKCASLQIEAAEATSACSAGFARRRADAGSRFGGHKTGKKGLPLIYPQPGLGSAEPHNTAFQLYLLFGQDNVRMAQFQKYFTNYLSASSAATHQRLAKMRTSTVESPTEISDIPTTPRIPVSYPHKIPTLTGFTGTLGTTVFFTLVSTTAY